MPKRDVPIKGVCFGEGGIASAPIPLLGAVVGAGCGRVSATAMSPVRSLGWARSPSKASLGAPREEDEHPHARERWLGSVDTSLVSQIYTLIFLH